MKITVELEQKDFDAMHEVIYEVFEAELTNRIIEDIWYQLPNDIKCIALQWGCSDSVFRDNLYVFLKNKKKNGSWFILENKNGIKNIIIK